MTSSTLLRHISLAVVLSGLVLMNEFIFSGLLSSQFNLSFIVLLYLCYLISQSHLVAGRITLVGVDLSAILICWFSDLSIGELLLVYLAMIWLNRALLCYSSLLAILADLTLCLFTASVVYWLFLMSFSLTSIVWCLLLLQALHSLIPGKKKPVKKMPSGDGFEHALETAESALQRLLNQS